MKSTVGRVVVFFLLVLVFSLFVTQISTLLCLNISFIRHLCFSACIFAATMCACFCFFYVVRLTLLAFDFLRMHVACVTFTLDEF